MTLFSRLVIRVLAFTQNYNMRFLRIQDNQIGRLALIALKHFALEQRISIETDPIPNG